MGLTTSTVKHVLLILNFVLTVLSCVLIGFGIFILVSSSGNLVDHGEKVAGGLVITIGALVLIISLFGCLAAIHEARKRLFIFVIALGILILLQLLMNAMASQGSKDGIAGSVDEGFDELWELEKKRTGALAYYEEWLHCCGVNGTMDYKIINHNVPKSCCVAQRCLDRTSMYAEGCKEKFIEYLAGKMLTFNIVSWILIILEVAAATFGWMLVNSLKNESRRNVGWM